MNLYTFFSTFVAINIHVTFIEFLAPHPSLGIEQCYFNLYYIDLLQSLRMGVVDILEKEFRKKNTALHAFNFKFNCLKPEK